MLVVIDGDLIVLRSDHGRLHERERLPVIVGVGVLVEFESVPDRRTRAQVPQRRQEEQQGWHRGVRGLLLGGGRLCLDHPARRLRQVRELQGV
ncbi:MAG: hypothetical protein IPH03_08700 [Tetrasphaera sp.]|nr:hypothetical protein [Tetrasphaera sp.]